MPPWIIKPKDNSLLMNVLCQLFYSNLICTRWRHDTSVIMISRHSQVLLKLPDLNQLWYQKRGWRDQTKNLTTSTSLIKAFSLLIFWDKPLFLTPFSPNSSQNISICIHWSLDRNNSCTHRSAEQKNRIQNLHLAIHKNLQRAQYFWLQSIHQKSNINTGLAFEDRALGVHSTLWASNPIPHKMLQCMPFFTLLDQRPMTWLPSSPNCTLKTPNSGQFVPHLPLVLKETNSHIRMISSSVDLKSFLHSHSTHSFYAPLGFPLDLWCSLLP